MTFPELTPYWLTVALHGVAISLVATLAVRCSRHPRARATAAVIGLLALAVIPWLSAIRLPEHQLPAALKVPAETMPDWRITLRTVAPTVPAEVMETSASLIPVATNVPHSSISFFQALALLWLTGTSVAVATGFLAARRIRSWRSSLKVPTDTESETLASLTQLPRRSIFVSNTAISPCVTGLLRPILILPGFLLSPDQRRFLVWALRHEEEHLRGNDLRWLAGLRIIRAVFWWNPLVHYLVARWSEAREQLCDLRAACTTEDRADYSRFLIEVGSRSRVQLHGTLAMADRRSVSRLKRRIVFLLDHPVDRPIGKRFVAMTFLLLLVCGVILPSCGFDSHPDSTSRMGATAGAVLGGPISTSSASGGPFTGGFGTHADPQSLPWKLDAEIFDIPESRLEKCNIPQLPPGLSFVGNYTHETEKAHNYHSWVGVEGRKLPTAKFPSSGGGAVEPWPNQLPQLLISGKATSPFGFELELRCRTLKAKNGVTTDNAVCFELDPLPGFKRRLLFLSPTTDRPFPR